MTTTSYDRKKMFFYLKESKKKNGGRQSRTTPSGSWKLTGDPVNVNDRRVLTFSKAKSSSSTSSISEWVMHELHYTHTDLPEHKKKMVKFGSIKDTDLIFGWEMQSTTDFLPSIHTDLSVAVRTTYVICRLEYKGHDVTILSVAPCQIFGYSDERLRPKTYQNGFKPFRQKRVPTPPTMANSASSVVDQSLQGNSGHYNTLSEYDSGHQFNGNYDMQQSFQGYSEYFNPTSEYGLANQSHWFGNLQQQVPYSAPYQDDSDMLRQVVEENWTSLVDERTCMREDRSHHRPKNPITGILPGDSSDDDTDSTRPWSSTDSVGSKDVPYHTPKDDTSSLSTVEPFPNHEAQEKPKQLELHGKEKVINMQKNECEWKLGEDSIKKAPSTTAVKQSWIVLEEMSQRNSQWIYLKNMIIGFLLSVSFIGWIKP
uniref:NAC domain-containing protein n=1 Tax=Brassica oleracea var. oleracea TaxID=109376 RepID=A0A0D3C713_BRAOL